MCFTEISFTKVQPDKVKVIEFYFSPCLPAASAAAAIKPQTIYDKDFKLFCKKKVPKKFLQVE